MKVACKPKRKLAAMTTGARNAILGDVVIPIRRIHACAVLTRYAHDPRVKGRPRVNGTGRRMRTITQALIGSSIVFRVALSLAPTASADASVDQFAAALAANDIPAISGLEDLVKTAHEVCDHLGSESTGQVVEEFETFANRVTPGRDPARVHRTAIAFVRASSQTFCPGAAAAYSGHSRIILAAANAPAPLLPSVPDAQQMIPPKAVAPSPAPKQAPPVVGPPHGSGGGEGGTGGGVNGGGGNDGPGTVTLAP